MESERACRGPNQASPLSFLPTLGALKSWLGKPKGKPISGESGEISPRHTVDEIHFKPLGIDESLKMGEITKPNRCQSDVVRPAPPCLGPPVVHLLPTFWGASSPTKIDREKLGTLAPTSPPEDLAVLPETRAFPQASPAAGWTLRRLASSLGAEGWEPRILLARCFYRIFGFERWKWSFRRGVNVTHMFCGEVNSNQETSS